MISPIAHRQQLCIVGYCNGTTQSLLGSPPVTRHPPFMINPSLTLLLHYHTPSQYSSSTLLAKDTEKMKFDIPSKHFFSTTS